MPNVTDYTRTYTTFSGCDIVATFNGIVIGELQAITYSVSREKAPVYTMGSAEPRSFSRGKRGIAGSLVFTVFDRDALVAEMTSNSSEEVKIQKYQANDFAAGYMSVEGWDEEMSNLAGSGQGSTATTQSLVKKYLPKYADEILPFDITITFANEYGQRAVMTVYGVELLNEGGGFSIDSVTSEKAFTYIARRIDHMKPVTNASDSEFSSSW